MAFTYRLPLGRPLTWAEYDGNLSAIQAMWDQLNGLAYSTAAAAAFKGNWSNLSGSLAIPASVYHSGQYWMLLENVADVTAQVPGVSTKWAALPSGNVQGPVSSVDGDGVVFDGTTGKLTKSLGAAPVKKTGDTMTGPLVLPANGLTLGTNQLVASGGFVGIGTAAPNARLHVSTPASTATAVTISDATTYTLRAGYAYSAVGHFGGAPGTSLFLRANGVDTLQVNNTGSVLAVAGPLGYGVGAGGTVTQPTNKSTAVTLNKPSGQITMNNAALAGNTTVTFTLNNTFIASVDSVTVNTGNAKYSAIANFVSAGACQIRVTNLTAGSLSDALTLNFSVVKVATS